MVIRPLLLLLLPRTSFSNILFHQYTLQQVVLKGSRNVLSKCADANFHMKFVVCVFAAKYVAPPPLILPGKRLNRNVIEGYNIEDDNITTSPKGFINSNLF